MMMHRTAYVKVRCDATPPSNKKSILPLLNTQAAKKRNDSIKENINKLIAIGTNEVKEFTELMKEFDIAHKKALDVLKTSVDLPASKEETDNIFLD